jgi:hypothetical protein
MPSPPFDQAVNSFQEFLESVGWPTEIVWARASDLAWQEGVLRVRTTNVTEARRHYEVGRQVGLGVLLDAKCILAGLTCASVEYPIDEDEAERLMYPSDGSLKLGVPVRRTEGLRVELPDSDG